MVELRWWLTVLSIIGASWLCIFGGLWISANYSMPPDEPPDAFGVVSVMMLIPVVVLLLLITGTWFVAAIVRGAVLLTCLITTSALR